MPIGVIAGVISILGEVLLWGGAVWLFLKSACKNKKIPYWGISLVVSASVLFLVGGLIP